MLSLLKRWGFKEKMVENPSPIIESEPFTTQVEVLKKYGLGQHPETNEFVGMCRPMTHTYVDTLLHGEDPAILLEDDADFTQKSIIIENAILADKQNGAPDVDHYVFQKNNIPHKDMQVRKEELSSVNIRQLLEQGKHLLFTYPTETQPGTSGSFHQAYLGREGSDLEHGCRLFDANVRGGEQKGPCTDIVDQFMTEMKMQYAGGDQPFLVGISAP